MISKLKFTEVRDYLASIGLVLETTATQDMRYKVVDPGKPDNPKYYRYLHNALVFNARGNNLTDQEVIGKLEKWILERWQGEQNGQQCTDPG